MLSFKALLQPDVGNAIEELLQNAATVAVAGFPHVASQALALLHGEGPWRLPRHGRTRHSHQRVLPAVCFLADVDCPATTEQEAMPPEALRRWAVQRATDELGILCMPTRLQIGPLGQGWSSEFLANLSRRVGEEGDSQPHRQFGRFCADVEMLLQSRLSEHLATSQIAHGLLRDEIGLSDEGLSQFTLAEVDIAPEAQGIATLALVRTIAGYCQVTGFPGGYMDQLFACALLLTTRNNDEGAAKEVAHAWLQNDAMAQLRLLDLSVVPSLKRMIQKGVFLE